MNSREKTAAKNPQYRIPILCGPWRSLPSVPAFPNPGQSQPGTNLWLSQFPAKLSRVGERKVSASPEASSRLQRLAAAVGPWQPLTGRGVAAFRAASLRRLMTFQFLLAIGSALIVVWTVRHIWYPPFEQALTQLPEVAGIKDADLRWPNAIPVRLAENPWVDFIVTPGASSELGQTADLQVEFRSTELRLSGLAGHLQLPYPPDLALPLGRIEATARWGAWRWVVTSGLGLATGLGLWVCWWVLATVYTLPGWVLGIILGRPVTLLEAWKLATASLMSGSLFAGWAILAYGLGAVRLPGFSLLFGLHFAMGWLWLFWGLKNCPAAAEKRPANPFDQ